VTAYIANRENRTCSCEDNTVVLKASKPTSSQAAEKMLAPKSGNTKPSKKSITKMPATKTARAEPAPVKNSVWQVPNAPTSVGAAISAPPDPPVQPCNLRDEGTAETTEAEIPDEPHNPGASGDKENIPPDNSNLPGHSIAPGSSPSAG